MEKYQELFEKILNEIEEPKSTTFAREIRYSRFIDDLYRKTHNKFFSAGILRDRESTYYTTNREFFSALKSFVEEKMEEKVFFVVHAPTNKKIGYINPVVRLVSQKMLDRYLSSKSSFIY